MHTGAHLTCTLQGCITLGNLGVLSFIYFDLCIAYMTVYTASPGGRLLVRSPLRRAARPLHTAPEKPRLKARGFYGVFRVFTLRGNSLVSCQCHRDERLSLATLVRCTTSACQARDGTACRSGPCSPALSPAPQGAAPDLRAPATAPSPSAPTPQSHTRMPFVAPTTTRDTTMLQITYGHGPRAPGEDGGGLPPQYFCRGFRPYRCLCSGMAPGPTLGSCLFDSSKNPYLYTEGSFYKSVDGSTGIKG